MLKQVGTAFGIKGEIIKTVQIDTGHINQTHFVLYKEEDGTEKGYTFQEINTYVFKNPKKMMDNIGKVTKHIRDKVREEGGDPYREVLHFLRAKNDERFAVMPNDRVWRVYNFIDGARTYDVANDNEVLQNAGEAFGIFQKRLADFPMDTLYETIPNFHNTEKRFNDLFEAVEEDPFGRVCEVKDDIEYLRSNFELAKTFNKLLADGKICLRVTHNDTKYNNILIDDKTGKALCVIDLDTVMPGLAAFDFGDAIRFAACSTVEDEKNLSKVYIDMSKYEAFTKGFIGASNGFFTDTEVEYMALGARMMALETTSRFLEDYIRGDKYFRVHYKGQNLVRSRCQAELSRSMEKEYDNMRAIVEKYK
ncbi:MAG: mucin desulfatase [Clostridiales bacterium]|nr:MAG: mucin desulfatase [Clostridiales bacterium]